MVFLLFKRSRTVSSNTFSVPVNSIYSIRFSKSFIICLLLLVVSVGKTFCITYYTHQSGNWTSPSTWSTVSCNNATNSGTFPGSNDNVEICNNNTTVTLDADITCNSITLDQYATLALGGHNFSSNSTTFNNDQQTISGTGNGSNTLSLGGNSKFILNAKILTTGYNVTFGGNLDISNGAYVSIGAGNLSIIGDFTNTVEATNSRIDWTDGTVTIGGNITVGKKNYEPFNCSGIGWLFMNSASKTLTVSNLANNDITVRRFRQTSSGYNKTGPQKLIISTVFDQNCGPAAPSGVTISVPANTVTCPSFSATALTSFGNVCTGATVGPNSFTVTGISLTTSNVTVGSLSGFTFSTSPGGTYTGALSLSQGGGPYSQVIYVQFNPTIAASYTGNIVVGGGGASNINIAAVGSGASSVAPTITSPTSSNVLSSSAILGGNITVAGCSSQGITERGIYYSTTNGFADGAGTKVSETGTFGTGVFTENVTGLSPSTTYYYKAFATNNSGTVYTAQGTFNNIPITYYTHQSGNWTAPSTWSTVSCNNATNTGTYPGPTDNVEICYNTTVTLNANVSCNTITLDQLATLVLGGYNFSSTTTTISSDQQTISGTGNGSNTLSLGGNSALTFNNAKINTTGYNVTIAGNPTVTNNAYFNIGTANLAIGGNLSVSTTAYVLATGNNSTIGGNLDISNNSYVSIGAGNLTIAGGYTNTLNTYYSRIDWTTGTVTIGGNISVGLNGYQPFNCSSSGWLFMNSSLKTFTVNSDIIVPRFRQTSSGFLKAGGNTLTISTVFDQNCGPAAPSGVTISIPANTVTCPSFSATALTSFGNVCTGSTAGPNSFTITGTSLTASNVTVGPLSGFTFSTTQGGTYTGSLSLSQGGGPYSQVIYVQFNPTTAVSYTGNIVVGGGGAPNINIAAVGSGASTVAPTITSPTSSNVLSSSAILGGNITAAGCSSQGITERGIYYSTSNGFADGSGTKVSESGTFGTGVFTENVTGLLPSTTYYYKAFATNNSGTVYTAQGTFNNIPITYYTHQSGNWTAPSTWSTVSCNNATNTGTYPGPTDNVEICYGTTVTLNANVSCNTITLDQSATLVLGGYNFSSTTTTINSDQQTISGTGNGSNTLSLGGNLTLIFNAKINTTGYNVMIAGNLNASNGAYVSVGASNLIINGNLTLSTNSNIQDAGGNVTVGGNLDISNSSYVSIGVGNLTIAGGYTNMTNDSNTKIDWSNGTVTIGGNITVGKNGMEPFTCTGTGWIFMNSSSKTITLSNPIVVLRFRQSASGFLEVGGNTLTISTVFDQNCGPVAPAGVTISIPGNTLNNTINTISLTSAGSTNSQTICNNSSIITIKYSTTGATGASVTGLPAGVSGSWAGNVVTISGTPTVSGTFTYTVTLIGGCGTAAAAGTITVTPSNTILLVSAGGTNTQTICNYSSIATISYSTTGATGASITGLPAGVTGNWAGNVVTINGTPTVTGMFIYTVTLSGGCSTGAATGSITVNAILPVSVNIVASASGAISSGTSVTFTATPTNGGTAPAYQWMVNGTNAGTNSATYTYTPANNDVVTCILTSNASPCGIGSPSTSNFVSLAVYSKWEGTSGTSWNSGGNWLGGYVPNSGSDIVFDSNANNDLYLDQDRTIGKLINNSDKRLMIPPALCLTVNDSILSNDVTGDKIYIQSSSSASNGSLVFHNKTTKVYGTVEMYSKAYYDPNGPAGYKYKWQYFGIPVHSIVASPVFANSYVRQYNEPGWTGNTWIPLTESSTLNSLNGYEITQTLPETLIFQGELENSDLTKSLTNTTGAVYPGLHILSNPYTAAIDITKLNFTNMEASVYLYNTGSYSDWQINSGSTTPGNNPGQYVVVPKNTAGTSGIPAQIPSMQGFMVVTYSGGGTINIPYSSVVTKNTDIQRVSSFNHMKQKEKVCTVIEVKGSRYSDIMWIISDPVCTHNFDNGWDGYKMSGSSLTPQIYAIESDGNYQVNSVDDINNTDIGFKAGEDSIYTLVFNHQNLASRYNAVYLVDMLKNKTIDISQNGSSYMFNTNSGTVEKRFKIVTNPEVVTELPETNTSTDSGLSVYSYNRMINIKNNTIQSGELILYDTMGKIVEKVPFDANKVSVFSTKLRSGFYVAKAFTTSRKVIVNLVF